MRLAILLTALLLTACGGGEPEADDVQPDAHRPAQACARAEACR